MVQPGCKLRPGAAPSCICVTRPSTLSHDRLAGFSWPHLGLLIFPKKTLFISICLYVYYFSLTMFFFPWSVGCKVHCFLQSKHTNTPVDGPSHANRTGLARSASTMLSRSARLSHTDVCRFAWIPTLASADLTSFTCDGWRPRLLWSRWCLPAWL